MKLTQQAEEWPPPPLLSLASDVNSARYEKRTSAGQVVVGTLAGALYIVTTWVFYARATSTLEPAWSVVWGNYTADALQLLVGVVVAGVFIKRRQPLGLPLLLSIVLCSFLNYALERATQDMWQ